MINKSKLVLAYSGGLDTSYSLQKLSQDEINFEEFRNKEFNTEDWLKDNGLSF